MLTKFSVSNFKNFNQTYQFDLSQTKSYEFNSQCVQQGIVTKAIIYGVNGCGKSNLGFAIFDLVEHLTNNVFRAAEYQQYFNAFCHNTLAEFCFEFRFNGKAVTYRYGKDEARQLVYESFVIDGQDYLAIDRRNSDNATIALPGTETLKNHLGSTRISLISYVKNNAVLNEDAIENQVFNQFIDFVERMLFFRSVHGNRALGFKEKFDNISAKIIESGHLSDFERFLNSANVECQLTTYQGEQGETLLAFKMADKSLEFSSIASTGTMSLALFYYWYISLQEQRAPSFVYIDEFDAYYHHALSALVVEKLKDVPQQVILTTHNTAIMTNDLLRPDCYFLMDNKQIKSLAHSTSKELRFAHNIEKMYKAGSFSVW